MKVLSNRVWKAGQSWNFERIVRQHLQNGTHHVFRVTIVVNSYDCQSYAIVDRAVLLAVIS